MEPKIRIPKGPTSKYTEPKVPDIADDEKGTGKALKSYEDANAKNKAAIKQRDDFIEELRKTYNK